jgi:hypothetical protein
MSSREPAGARRCPPVRRLADSYGFQQVAEDAEVLVPSGQFHAQVVQQDLADVPGRVGVESAQCLTPYGDGVI